MGKAKKEKPRPKNNSSKMKDLKRIKKNIEVINKLKNERFLS